MYDVLIVGAGPAGLTAAIYAARNNLKVGIFEGNVPGGQVVVTATVENYPGYSKIDGPDLAYSMFEQTMNLGVELIGSNVIEIKKLEDHFKIITEDEEFLGRVVIIATGTSQKKLEVPGESNFESRGISWCAICDGSLYKGKDVAVVGGGNSALEETIYLSNIVNKVYLIHRRQEFRAESHIVNKVRELKNVEFVLDSVVDEFIGDKQLGKIRLRNVKNNQERVIEVSGCFEYVGQIPATSFVENLGITDEAGYILVDENFETKVENLFACGDVLVKNIRQIVTATSDGASAALNAIKKLS
ncbi:MAG: thioredoxin-disulfide reductase [Bacilli bacterium]